jgi:His-Xaa-Ser system protein HxsD
VCYLFTDKCYLFLQPQDPNSIVQVKFSRKKPDADLSLIAAEFSNELINQKVRLDVAAETQAIRELIVAQAFAESSLLDDSFSASDYCDDPKGIS